MLALRHHISTNAEFHNWTPADTWIVAAVGVGVLALIVAVMVGW